MVSACSHAGAVNVLQNARRLTGRDQIAGFVGGFHLTGAVFEPIIEPTIAALTDLGVERFVPGHCTGWKATHRLAAALPDGRFQAPIRLGLLLASVVAGAAGALVLFLAARGREPGT